jgi:hypothetical protein
VQGHVDAIWANAASIKAKFSDEISRLFQS